MTAVRLEPAGAEELSDDDVRRALTHPIGTPSLATIAAGRTRVAIAIDDVTRPTPTARILQPLVQQLNTCGFDDDSITVIVATGAHRPASERDIRWKLGPLFERVRTISHDPHGALRDTGVELAGTPVRLHPAYLEADLRIGIGAVMPHPFAWFSGGAKVVLPGLADLEVVARSHRFALMGFHGGHDAATNRFRRIMESAVRTIGLDWTVGAVVDERRRLVGLVAGDVVDAHRKAAELASAAGATVPPRQLLDGLLLNAYPKDAELLQMEAALVGLRRGVLGWLKPEAPIVLMGAASDGLGRHGLFGPGGRLFRSPGRLTVLGQHPLILFAPGASREDASQAFWRGYRFTTDWAEVQDWLDGGLPPNATLGIIPAGPLQLPAPTSHQEGATS
jgi:nickel-dependent lactate racemase